MKRRWIGAALAALLFPLEAQAHDAFGDLGPFYGGLLHPLVDPAQGLILVALAVLLARQPIDNVRVAYVAAVMAAVLAALVHTVSPIVTMNVQIVGVIVAAIGLLALSGYRLPLALLVVLSGGLAGLAGAAGDVPLGSRALALSVLGTAIGGPLIVLLIWSALDLLQTHVGRIAGAVAGSWLAAIGLMAAALPDIAT